LKTTLADMDLIRLLPPIHKNPVPLLFSSVWQTYAVDRVQPGNQNALRHGLRWHRQDVLTVFSIPQTINQRRNSVRIIGGQRRSRAGQHGDARAGGDHCERRFAVGKIQSRLTGYSRTIQRQGRIAKHGLNWTDTKEPVVSSFSGNFKPLGMEKIAKMESLQEIIAD